MRTRTRNVILRSIPAAPNIASQQFGAYCDGSTDMASITRSRPYIITDLLEEGISDSLGRGVPHSCVHRRKRTTIVEHSGEVQAVTAPKKGVSTETTPYWRAYLGAAFYHPGLVGTWSVDPVSTSVPQGWTFDTTRLDENALKEQVLDNARQMKADILLNLVEANQMWPAVKSLSTCIPEMAYNWGRIRQVVKHASGAFLAWKFGISPIISDMESVQKHLPRISEGMQRHADGDKSRYSVTAELPVSYLAQNQSNLIDGIVVWRKSTTGRLILAPVVRYVLTVKPNVKYGTAFFSKADYFMRRFASSPASLAWEKVPFSFVVDWFVDLRGVLRALDKSLGFEPYEIVSFTRSFSYRVMTESHFARFSPCTGAVLYADPVGSTEFSHYERATVTDKALMPNLPQRFGKNQAAISAALILQKLSSLRTKR